MIALLATAVASANVAMPPPQRYYTQACGGCHGLQGQSAKQEIPELAGEVGRFWCTARGRAYVVRLPNVAFAGLSNAQLAETLNFMMYSLGGASVPAGKARPYSAAEVGALRRQPLKATDVLKLRAAVLADATPACLTKPFAVTRRPSANSLGRGR